MSNLVKRSKFFSRLAFALLSATVSVTVLQAQYVSTAVTGLSHPAGVAVDTNNNVYITDPGSYTIKIFVPSDGSLSVLAGSGNPGADPGIGTEASFYIPQGIVYARGGLIVADEGSQLIRFVTTDGIVSNLAGQPFVAGSANGNGSSATFSYPTGLASDANGNIYVADSQNNAIRKIDVNNNVTTMATGGYKFDLPNAVAIDSNNVVWVADSGHNNIVVISNGIAAVIAGSTAGQTGTNDSLVALNARFRDPLGLLWQNSTGIMFVSDSGNSTVRSIFLTNFNGNTGYAVQTAGGISGKPGFINGALTNAQFNQPEGLAIDNTDLGVYVADTVNNALRVLQASAPLAAVTSPEIGFVTFPPNASPPYSSVFVPSTSAVFNNLTNIAIVAEAGTETYITYGPTGTSIPTPGPGSYTPPTYPGDGSAASEISSAISPGRGTNDITIYAISVQSGRQSSPLVRARYQFITANPLIVGNNAADIVLLDATIGAEMYYSIDGSAPTNDGTSLGPVTSDTTLSLNITTNVLLQVRAFATGLATSQIVSNELSISNVIGNTMAWGFSSGPASSHLVTAHNLSFSAPITYTEIPTSLPVYSFQFDAVLTNAPGSTSAPPKLYPSNFVCDLLQPDPSPPIFQLLLPGIFDGVAGVTNYGITTTQPSALEIGWLVSPPVTNLYTSPNLLEYSGSGETLFTLETTGTLLGSLDFLIPADAPVGTPYLLQELFPSASSFTAPDCCGSPINVLVQTPTNGPLTGTSPNSIKLVTILSNNAPESAHLVGDVYPNTWFNIGDFGDSVILNDDVIQTMEAAIGFGSFAYPTNSPYYDAMDSSNGKVNSFYGQNDATLDVISNGDGYIDISDVYVTLRRSLDPTLVNYSRYWNGSNWVATVYTNSVQESGKTATPNPSPSPQKLSNGGLRYVTIGADQVQTSGGLTAQVPIRILAADPIYPIRVALLNVEIDPLDGSPAIMSSISFNAVTNLGKPFTTISKAANVYGASWLDSGVSGVAGTNLFGTLTVNLPSTVNTNSAYLVRITTFSGSPNGFSVFKSTTQNGLITVGNRSGSSWNDGIPDSWRLLYFGTVSDPMSAANFDPDGDGANNWQEYIAGTDPLNSASVFQFASSSNPVAGAFTLQWPSVVNKTYTLQWSSALGSGWTTVASNLIGNSQVLQWTDTNASAGARFYRAVVH